MNDGRVLYYNRYVECVKAVLVLALVQMYTSLSRLQEPCNTISVPYIGCSPGRDLFHYKCKVYLTISPIHV